MEPTVLSATHGNMCKTTAMFPILHLTIGLHSKQIMYEYQDRSVLPDR